MAWFLQGGSAAQAAGFGGLTGLITTVYLAFRIITRSLKVGDGMAVGGMGVTQLAKYAMVVALFYVALKVFKLPALPLIAAFAATQAAYWLVLIVNPKMAK